MPNLKLGRIAGIPLSANLSVLGIAAFVIYSLSFSILPDLFPTAPLVDRLSAATICAVMFLASILGHELGHAFVAKRHDVGVEEINLWILGGVAKLTRQAPTPVAEFQIAVAGPLASLALGVVFAGLALITRAAGMDGPGPLVLVWLGSVNAVLAISNMLPAAPLDGGRVLTAAIWKRNGDAETARLYSARCGIIAGLLLFSAGTYFILLTEHPSSMWWSATLTGAFLVIAAKSEAVGAAVRRRLGHTDVGTIMTSHPTSIPADTPMDRFEHWAGEDCYHVAYPVLKWGYAPIGYLTPARGSVLSPAERSWTSVAAIMVPSSEVPRAWTTESADTVLRRMESSYPLAVVHDVASSQMVGTISQAQLHGLIAKADWWGRLATEDTTTEQVPVRN